ncbi:uncharacterized protein LOC117824564, partial [Notolabrus celidotus]|uniref:uncharacterized protein LOC117824564 n=1 Tax=Notolabrus celidotus TaxID=1203425 RepID=UPI00148FF88C
RLSVTEDCSLVIKKVTEEDVGQYVCRLYPPGGTPEPEAVVDLSLLSMTEIKDGDQVTLRCFVRTYGRCTLRVRWLFEGKDVDDPHQSVVTSQGHCFTDVTFPSYQHMYKSRNDSLQCEVTAGNKVKLFPFSPQLSAGKPTEVIPTTGTTPTPENNHSSDGKGWRWLWLYVTVAVVLLTALLVVIVIVIRLKRTKGSGNDNLALTSNHAGPQAAAETSQNAADPEDGVAYASVSYTKKSDSEARVRRKDNDEDGCVMYATVKASTSSSAAGGASIDPSCLYATVGNEKR